MFILKKLFWPNDSENESTTLACFSPQVMALTFVLEMLLMMRVLVKYGAKSMPLKLISFILLFLALFQLSEYGVCEGLGFSSTIWARIGFASITMLPALGVHLVQSLKQDKNMVPTYVAYAMSAVFVLAFTVFDSFMSASCGGNYAIFELTPPLGGAFFVYYYLLMLIGANLAVKGYRAAKDKETGNALLAIAVGYATFVVPASLIHLFYESAQDGLPSIMCGFALIFAFILGLYIAKRVPAEDKKS